MTEDEAKERISRRIVQKAGGCWEWQGATLPSGYGVLSFNGRRWYSHRLAFTAYKGPIPTGLQIDHLCRNTSCCNPEHLEAVTQRENALRGFGFSGMKARQESCINGHPFDQDNTYYHGTSRKCRACRRELQRRLRANAKAIPA